MITNHLETMRARCLSAYLVAACWPLASPAALDPTDTIQIEPSASLYHDSNLFRLPDVDPRLFGISPENKSDTARVLGIGLKLDKPLSRQRLVFDLTLNETHYDNNTNLDFFGGDGRLSWLWQAGNQWSGEVGYRRKRALGGFADFRRNVQDLIDTDTYTLTGGYQFHPRWRVAAQLIDQESTHSAAVRQNLDVRSKDAALTLTYRTPDSDSIGLQARHADRSYPNRPMGSTFDNGHTETRINALLAWRLSGVTKLDAGIGHVDVRHDTQSQRDFSGLTWRVAGAWDPGAKLRVNLNAWRDVRLYEDVATNYIVLDVAELSPVYALTSKLSLRGDLSFESRDYRGDPRSEPVTIDRDGNIRLGRLALTYSPIRSVDVSLAYEVGTRRAKDASFNYDYESWFASVKLGL